MAVSSMLKIQLLGHNSVKGDVKRLLRVIGAVQVTEFAGEDIPASGPGTESAVEEGDLSEKLEKLEDAISFLEEYREKKPFLSRIGEGPILVSGSEIAEIDSEISIDRIWAACDDVRFRIEKNRQDLSISRELVFELSKWINIDIPLDSMETEGYQIQLWTLAEKQAELAVGKIERECELSFLKYCSEDDGSVRYAVALPLEDPQGVADILKEHGGFRSEFKGVEGTPQEAIDRERENWAKLEHSKEKAEAEARELSETIDKLYVLFDYYYEKLGLREVEYKFYHTDSTFTLEGWIREADRRRLKKSLAGRFEDIEVAFRKPRRGEAPPIHLENRTLARPAEFVTTLYGRPVYGEADPTPFLAPFFILFFAMCLTDAGYGVTLSAMAAFILVKFRPSAGAAKLIRLLLVGGLVTAVVGILAGGIFGLGPDSIPAIKRLVFVNPLQEPMKVLYISFLLGLVHMIFGMGISMVQKMRMRLIADAIFDNLFWILFLLFLAPLGYSAILGGSVPQRISYWSVRGSVVLAALILVTGGRKKDSFIMKILGGLVGFYDVVGYFGDVLSYARLLALGLATSAIAIAVNDIAKMVTGMPMYVGYLLAGLVLMAGHAFNLAVNTLGGFVHSARLQYLEFFSKFFTGGGRPFEPFRSERRYSRLTKNNAD